MPNYNIFPIATSVLPGDVFYFFGSASAGDTITPAQASRQFAMGYVPAAAGDPTALGVDFHFASSPTTPVVQIQVSNVDADGSYITVYDSTTDTNAGQNWHVDVPLGMYRFVRAKLVSVTGGGAFTAVGTR